MRNLIVVGLMMMSGTALASSFSFDCKMLDASHGLVFNGLPMKVKISQAAIQITVKDGGEVTLLKGKVDPAYISRDQQGRTFIRYPNLYGSPEGEMIAVIEGKMAGGKGPALLKMQWRGESFYQDLYRCVLKK